MGNGSRKGRSCCYCGKPAVLEREGDRTWFRAWCARCLARVRKYDAVDLDEYPTQADSFRCGVPDFHVLT